MIIVMDYEYKDGKDKNNRMSYLINEIEGLIEEKPNDEIDLEELHKLTSLSIGSLKRYARNCNNDMVLTKLVRLNLNPDNNIFCHVESFMKKDYDGGYIESLTKDDCYIINEYMEEYNLPYKRSIVKSVISRYFTTGSVYRESDNQEEQMQFQDNRIVIAYHEKRLDKKKIVKSKKKIDF